MHLFETKRDFLTSNEYNGRICGAYYFARETQKRGRKVGQGQAQVSRQRNVPHRKAEIIYKDWSGNYRRRRARKRKEYLARMTAAIILAIFLSLICFWTGAIYQWVQRDVLERLRDDSSMEQTESISDEVAEEQAASPEIIKNFLEINDFSRPGTELEKVKSIFVHYTANPGTSAAQNRSYFSNLALTHETSASAHLIIGYDGEIVQCIPFDEQAYAVMTRNNDSISIECCYVSDDGSFTQETYDTLVHTLAWLLDKYDLTVNDILRHYDCGGKKCPIYYVEHEDAWERLLQDVAEIVFTLDKIEKLG